MLPSEYTDAMPDCAEAIIGSPVIEVTRVTANISVFRL
jgi:hypothetical protein